MNTTTDLLSAAEVMEKYGISKSQLDYIRSKGILPSTPGKNPKTQRMAPFFVAGDAEKAVGHYRENLHVKSSSPPKARKGSVSPEGSSAPAIVRAIQRGKDLYRSGFYLVVRKAVREWRAVPPRLPLEIGERRIVEYVPTFRTFPVWEVIPAPLAGTASRQVCEKLNRLERLGSRVTPATTATAAAGGNGK